MARIKWPVKQSDSIHVYTWKACIINPFMPNGIFHCYELDESISNFRVVGWYFSLLSNFKRNSCKQTVENLVRRRTLWRLHCLLMSHKKGAMLIWVKSGLVMFKLNDNIKNKLGSAVARW